MDPDTFRYGGSGPHPRRDGGGGGGGPFYEVNIKLERSIKGNNGHLIITKKR